MKLPSSFTYAHIYTVKTFLGEGLGDEKAIEAVTSLSEAHKAQAVRICEIPDEAAVNLPGSFTYHHIYALKKLLNDGVASSDEEAIEVAIEKVTRLSDVQAEAVHIHKIPYEIALELPSNFNYDHIATVKVEEEGSSVHPIRFSSVPSTSSSQSYCANIDPPKTSKFTM